MARAAVIALCFTAMGCGALPSIEPGVCGNGVLEPGEDCDGFGRDQLACRPPGQPGECHLDCSPRAGGSPLACPTGYGCDADQVCREATGEFVAVPDQVAGSAYSLLALDLNGDGQDDVISQRRPSVLGLTKIRAHYFDRFGAPSSTWVSNDPLGTPAPVALSGNPGNSLAHTRYGKVGVLSGAGGGALISEALPSFFLRTDQGRVIPVLDEPIGQGPALVVLTELDGETGLFVEAQAKRALEQKLALRFGVDDLAAEPLHVDLSVGLQSPCRELVLAVRGRSSLQVYDLCEFDETAGRVRWREQPLEVSLRLEPSARITNGLVAGDFDGDGHTDLLFDTDEGIYVVRGREDHPTPPVPVQLRRQDGQPLAMPLAAGDLSGDGRADVVTPTGISLSVPSSEPSVLSFYSGWVRIEPAWTAAAIADFNGNDLLDVIAVSDAALDMSFFNGTGGYSLNPFTVVTDRPIAHLATADFDGDLIEDAVIVQRGTHGREDEVSIAFGSEAGAPLAPQPIARVAHVEQVVPFRSFGETTYSLLGMMFAQTDREGNDGYGVAFLVGNGDRRLPCVVELSTFGDDESLDSDLGLAVVAGAFTAQETTDVMVLAAKDEENVRDYGAWLLPEIDARRADMRSLGWGLSEDVSVVVDRDTASKLAATLAAGDLDGDGVDEVVMTVPDRSREHCLLVTARVAMEGHKLAFRPAMELEEPCEDDTQLALADLDSDGSTDLLLLIGDPDQARVLYALWGQEDGRLDPANATFLAPDGMAPRAFDLLPGPPGQRPAVAFVEPGGLFLMRARGRPRSRRDPERVAPLSHGTGLAAADVNGDGVRDLVVADDGAVRVFRAALRGER
ncbi:MAG: FG-GAP and VCBS repeat-containing protein [Myxococcales bacterium]|nr:FG-GAP and VCBS repeat-containing protein [Myxococcales bacterium]